MLTLTENAATAVKSLVSRTADEQTGGLRIYGSGDTNGGFALSVVNGAETTDAVVEESGARIFLDENAAVVLAEQVLDARVEDGGVRFALEAQA
ncbi:MAG: Fe-S cluster assembly protein HesB [Microbacterium sp.]|uniref:iron-sulfur cluster biosynthesis family protein n=1 Tax=Microbacterium sp. TaxID=51671 RepID=UPI001AC0E509|nr:iron-sulfur cluster biosynthesis family protein [Microbacterium sp.]MBN9185019.1 Fe-S cluster assembly protein HesB [Microbacterium sp.]MBN9188327.1 Fe-S cluster assembly protein HesB [Microbacterium sp.]MBN9194314.1 Fe-S cluster assembly protein HesB [Microbacterium sp.]